MRLRSLLSLGVRRQSDTQSRLGGESMIRGNSWRSWLLSLLNPRRFVSAEGRVTSDATTTEAVKQAAVEQFLRRLGPGALSAESPERCPPSNPAKRSNPWQRGGA